MTDEQFQQLVLILGQVGNAAYAAALRRAEVNAWINGVTAVIGLIVFSASIVIGLRLIRMADKPDVTSEAQRNISTSFIIVLCVGVFSLFDALITAPTAIKLIYSPEFAALQYLATLVRGG
jgi:hypothetical protein